MEILKLINFDCKNERFAEVFGDIIETEDIERILKEALKLFDKSDLRAINSANNPDEAFEYLDCLTMEKLGKLSPRAKFGDRKYFLIRSFFRFVNDAYTWGDLEDLERWESELFDRLDNLEQKNYRPIKAESAKDYRTYLLNRFCWYLGKFAPETVQTVADELPSLERFNCIQYLGGF